MLTIDGVGEVRLIMKSGLVLVGLLGLAGPSAADVDISYLQGLGDVRHHPIEREPDLRPYHLYVRLPEEYAEGGVRFPVIYLLDGGLTFPLLAAYYHYLRLADEVSPAILVGISYGTDDWREGNRRSRDYTAPSPERDFWGGAEAFDEWLAGVVLPLVESTYRADPARRILFGHSIAGQFVLFETLRRPDRFAGLIASNPALHRNLDYFLEGPEGGTTPDAFPRLIVVDGSLDDERFAAPRAKWLQTWSERRERPFDLSVLHLEDETHVSLVPAAFRHGARRLLPPDITTQ